MLRKAILVAIITENLLNNLCRKAFKTKWALEGKCRKCGACCREIALVVHPKILTSRSITALVSRWISWVFDFHLIRIEYDMNYMIFGCKHIKTDGTCGNYKWRPSVCRNYPIVDYFKKPSLFDNCGYKAIKK